MVLLPGVCFQIFYIVVGPSLLVYEDLLKWQKQNLDPMSCTLRIFFETKHRNKTKSYSTFKIKSNNSIIYPLQQHLFAFECQHIREWNKIFLILWTSVAGYTYALQPNPWTQFWSFWRSVLWDHARRMTRHCSSQVHPQRLVTLT